MGVLLAGLIVVSSPAAAAGKGNGVVRHAAKIGTTKFSPSKYGTGGGGLAAGELAPGQVDAAGGGTSSHNQHGANRSRSIDLSSASVTGAPVVPGVGVSSAGPVPVVGSFDGLNHFQQRTANGGNQFSSEPPDQALCEGNGFVVESVNSAIRVYSTAGAGATGVEDLNTFFGYVAADNRSIPIGKPGRFGPAPTDPSCYFDPTTQRWFVDILTLDLFSDSGDFTGFNHLDIAVSTSADPTGTWNLYTIDVTDDGTNGVDHGCLGVAPYGQATVPTHPNACIGDYPHIGADANAIFLDTNEYAFFGNSFHGAQVYALSKADLIAGSPLTFVQIDTHNAVSSTESGFTLWPATASDGNFSTADGGTEYFLSSNAADEAHGDGSLVGPRRSTQLLEWSVTGTSNIDSAPASVSLSAPTILPVGLYVVPPRSEQKVGTTPLFDCLNNKGCATNVELGFPDPFAPEKDTVLDSNDSRIQQVTFADGMLWAALDTAVNSSANVHAGIEWFVVRPTSGGASLVKSGYLAAAQNNITYPAVAVTSGGKGVIAFTLVGRDYYPSAAFASIDVNGTGPVQVAALGAGPSDGFSGTAIFNAPNPPRPRWGDYGAAVADGNNIWIASEYVGQSCTESTWLATGLNCGHTRTSLANWDTRISEVAVS